MLVLTKEQLAGTVEAILFGCADAVALERIAQALGIKPQELEPAIACLEEKYGSPMSGVQLIKFEDSLQLCSNPAFIEPLREVLDLKRNTPLSPAAMEVLSLVAYNEPVTKAFIEQVRGVDCSGVIGSLTQKGLIEERGRLELPGRPLLYGTTDSFLRCFGISSLAELPPIPEDNKEEPETGPEAEAETEAEA